MNFQLSSPASDLNVPVSDTQPAPAPTLERTVGLSQIITGVDTGDDAICVRWADGATSQFDLLWLRDNCPAIRHPGTGQRLIDITELPLDLSIHRVQLETDGSLLIHWTSDRHVSRFSGGWLREHSYQPSDQNRPANEITTWNCELLTQLPVAKYAQITASAKALRDWLRDIRRFGFALLNDVPRTPGYVLKVAALFGYIRETNYGRLMDIQCQGEPNNLVFSNAALAPHTDNPYRDPVPTLKLLHCLKNCTESEGGESLLVDGLGAAEELRRKSPDQFSLLSSVKIVFRFQDATTKLECERTVIDLDSDGLVRGVYFNHRSMAPLRLPPGVMESYYRAYLAFAKSLQSPRNLIRFQLKPGDLYVVDNRRVLHGRTKYENPFDRHLQGCYADRDGLYSRLNILEKEYA